jgi:hypothetical protein
MSVKVVLGSALWDEGSQCNNLGDLTDFLDAYFGSI